MRRNRDGQTDCEQIKEMETIVRKYGGVENTIKEILRYRKRCEEILEMLPANAASAELAKIVRKCAQV